MAFSLRRQANFVLVGSKEFKVFNVVFCFNKSRVMIWSLSEVKPNVLEKRKK